MLHCVPRSVFSWFFDVTGSDAGPGEITFNIFTEQGTVSLGSERFDVVKHGVLSGRWTLESDGHVHAEATKSTLTRRFTVVADGVELELVARSPFGRAFRISCGDEEIGGVESAGIFTRRASIECPPSVSEPVQLFLGWLAILTWKRAAASSGQ